MSETDIQLDPGRIDLITLDEANNAYKLIVAASHIMEMGAADEAALRQKLTNYITVANSGELQRQYPQLSTMDCVIQVDVSSGTPQSLQTILSAFEAEASSNGLTLTICEID